MNPKKKTSSSLATRTIVETAVVSQKWLVSAVFHVFKKTSSDKNGQKKTLFGGRMVVVRRSNKPKIRANEA